MPQPRLRPRRPNELLQPITAPVVDICKITGLGSTTVNELIREGKLRSVCVGRRRLVFLASVDALLRGEIAA